MNERDDLRRLPGDPLPSDPLPDDAPELLVLASALAPLRTPLPPFDARWVPAPRAHAWPRWLALAALLLVSFALWWQLGADAALLPSSAPRTFVAAAAPRTVPLGDLAEVELQPGSELEFVHWRSEQARFALKRGAIAVRVQPPPKVAAGFFVVDTPLGPVVDQGCRYTLALHDDGAAEVVVTEGAVTFARGARTVFVPVGAATRVVAEGAHTPCFADASDELQKATAVYDAALFADDEAARGRALKPLLAAVRAPRDTLVLWHLLRDPSPQLREVAEQHLFDLVGPPLPNSKQVAFDAEEWLPFLRLRAWRPTGK